MNNTFVKRILPMLIFIIMCYISINEWSYWIDESSTMYFSKIHSIPDMFVEIWNNPGSENQMPGYMIFMWFWDKLFGHSEYNFRLSNLFFIIVLIIFFSIIYKKKYVSKNDKNLYSIFLLLSSCSPFILYNMNEARNNISLFVIGSFTIISLSLYVKYKIQTYWYICICSFIIGYFFNMLFAFIFPVILCLISRNYKEIILSNKKSITYTIIISVIISLYYISSLISGKGGAIESPGIKNIAYVFYEYAGFNGLGPSKNTIREADNLLLIIKPYLINIIILCICYFSFFSVSIKKQSYKWGKILFISISIFFIAAYIVKFRFWGRHLIMLYPLWLLQLANIIYKNWNTKINQVISITLFIILFISSIRIIYNPIYKKENIKFAIQKTNELNKNNDIVYFTEAKPLADFYQLRNYQLANKINGHCEGLYLWFKRLKGSNKTNPILNSQLYKSVLIYDDKDFQLYKFKAIEK